MSGGSGAALLRAGRAGVRQPLVWLPAVLVEAPLLVLGVAVARALLTAAATPLELRRAALVAGFLALAGWLVASWADGVRTVAADCELRGEPLPAGELLERAWRVAGGFLGLALLLGLLGPLLTLGQVGLALWLLTGGDLRALQILSGDTVVAGWAARGWLWVVGCLVLLALTGAAREMVRLAGVSWRAALVAERSTPMVALSRAVRFGYGRGRLLLGRWLLRTVVMVAAMLAPYQIFAILLSAAAEAGVAEVMVRLLTGTWLGVTVVMGLLARSWLAVTDLVLYRQFGGAESDSRLVTRGVRTPRPRRPRPPRPAGLLVVASEPGGALWQPVVVSEPGPEIAGRRPAGANEH